MQLFQFKMQGASCNQMSSVSSYYGGGWDKLLVAWRGATAAANMRRELDLRDPWYAANDLQQCWNVSQNLAA